MQAIFPTQRALSPLAGGHGTRIPATPQSRRPAPLVHQRHNTDTAKGPVPARVLCVHDQRPQPARQPPRIRPAATRQPAEPNIARRQAFREAMPEASLWGIGPLKAPAAPLQSNEDILLDRSWGLQSRKPFEGPVQNVIFGDYGKREHKYLFTVDARGINILREHTPFPTPRGMVVHTNISAKAVVAGECWFRPGDLATINAGSKRFPLQEPLEWDESSLLWRLPAADGAAYAALALQWQRVAQLWVSLGYEVEQIPLGQRFGAAVQPRRFTRPAPIPDWRQPGAAAEVSWLTRSPSCSRYAGHGARRTT